MANPQNPSDTAQAPENLKKIEDYVA